MTKISYFERATTNKVSKEVSLDYWLKKTIKPNKTLRNQISKYRNLGSANLKRKIPCVTISASFKKVRSLDKIKKKNPFIVLDIDRYAKDKKRKCNLCLDFDLAKEMFIGFSSCYYVGYSVSSDGLRVKNGMYAIIILKKGTSLKKAFKHFEKRLSRIGINIDESCKDYTRLRFMSYDPKAYYNPKAKPFKLPKKQKAIKSKLKGTARKDDKQKVEAIISLIESQSIDITSNYDDWYKIAGALYVAFGENGRDYFHRVSKFYPKYKKGKTDKKYSNCSNMNRVSLSTFFHIANNYGLRY